MSSITGVVNVDNTLTGIEDLFLDELDVNDVNAENISSTSVSSSTISLGGNDLQTTLDNLQAQIVAPSTGGGFFTHTCEYNGNWTQGDFFSWGGGVLTNASILCNNQTLVGFSILTSTGTPVTSNSNVRIERNGTQVVLMTIPNGTTGTTNTNLNVAFVLGDTLRVRFVNTAGQGSGGGGFRVSLLFRTAPVNGTNGINGTDGTNGSNGQNVSFNVPTIATITPITTASINDTITTASGTQNHSLNFNIPRGKNSSFQVGTISSVGTGSPSLALVQTTDGNGDNVFTMNFGLQQGVEGNQGNKGDKGDQGDQAQSTIIAIASASAAGVSAGIAGASASSAAISAGLASTNGASAGAQAGSQAAEAVLSSLDTRVTTLEGEMDTQQTKTQYISQSATETFIGGSKTIVNSTNGLLTNTLEANSLNISTTINTNDLNVTGDSYFANDILLGDTKKLLTNQIVQRQYPANGDILLDATNLNIGSSFCDAINLQGDDVNFIVNTGAGIITFENSLANTDVNVLIDGIATITENLTAGTSVSSVSTNNHILRGTTAVNTIKGINNASGQQILNIGNTTHTINAISTNLYSTNTIFDVEATDITLSSDLDFSTVVIGSILNKNTSATINTRDINIGTNAIGMTAPTLNIGTYNRTSTEIRGETIEISASQTTSINGSSNLVLDATTIDIGHSTSDINIQGSTIDIGTVGIANVINIGNNFSSVNINTIDTQFINVDNFFNQLGF